MPDFNNATIDNRPHQFEEHAARIARISKLAAALIDPESPALVNYNRALEAELR